MHRWIPPTIDDEEDDALAMEDVAVDRLRMGQFPALDLDEVPEL